MKVSSVFVVCLAIVLAEPSVPVSQYILTPSPQYGTPSNQYGAPNDYTITLVPTEQYGTPNLQYNYQVGVPNTQYSAPGISNNAYSENYIATGLKTSGQTSKNHLNQNSKSKYVVSTSTKSKPQYDIHNTYLASTEGNYLDKYEANDEPANYGFKYYVQDATDGTDFGHEEDRQGDVASGRYYVLLPDGKRQTVEYTADAGGYKPRISYEQVGTGYAPDHGYEQDNIKHGGYSR